MKVMILAAGRGSRMRPLTDNTPKPLLKIDQFSLIEHLLFRLADQGFQEIIINLAHLGHQIVEKLKEGRQYGVDIVYSEEEATRGLETGGGIHNALPLLGSDPFLVVSGDIWTDYDFSQLKKRTLSGLIHLVLVDNPPEHPSGDFNLLGDKIIPGEGRRLTFGNMGIYHPDLFKDCEPGFFPLAPLLHKAVERGMATGEHFKGAWVNVGTPETLTALRQKLMASL